MKGAPDDKCHHHLSFIDHHDWQTSRRREFTGQKSISHIRQTATIGLWLQVLPLARLWTPHWQWSIGVDWLSMQSQFPQAWPNECGISEYFQLDGWLPHTRCPARALMPYLLQSLMSCWAMVVKGQMTTIVEPVKVKFKYSKQVQVLYQAEGEERPPTWARTYHSQLAGLPAGGPWLRYLS